MICEGWHVPVAKGTQHQITLHLYAAVDYQLRVHLTRVPLAACTPVASKKQPVSSRRGKESVGEALARSLSPSASVDLPISAEARDNGRAFPRTFS